MLPQPTATGIPPLACRPTMQPSDQSSSCSDRRCCFFSPVTRFCFKRASLDDFGIRVRFRCFGATAASATSRRNLSKQSATFRDWSRYRWLVSTNSPRSLICRPHLIRSRANTLCGRATHSIADQRSTAFDATLFTFCPPGPELRTNVK